VVSRIRTIYQSGGRSIGGVWHVDFIESVPTGTREVALVNALISFSRQIVYARPGARPDHYPGGKQTFNFHLTYEGRWRITESTTA
jgi:hypothetical protein